MKILLISPYQYINVHAIPESIVANELKSEGHQIFQIGCDGVFNENCISMSAAGIWPHNSLKEKEAVCIQCKQGRNLINKRFKFNHSVLEDYLVEDDFSQISLIMKQFNRNNWFSYSYEGVYIGKIAAYEFLINYKINKVDLTEEQWVSYLPNLRGVLLAYFASKKILDYIKPERLLVYNNFYSVNHIFSLAAEARGIPAFSLHAGSHHEHRLSQMTIFKGHHSQFLVNKSQGWKRFSKLPLNIRRIESASSHIEELLTARSPWVYSVKYRGIESSELRKFFHINPLQKVLVATMACGDERFASSIIGGLPKFSVPIFESQLDWVIFLIELARKNPKYFLIIRVHPREFPNKRELVLSENAKKLKIVFQGLPKNVAINWPDDCVSLHDLIRIADVGLNSTSTAGLEMLMFGLPVVIYDSNQIFSYPSELNLVGETIKEYKNKIDQAVLGGWQMKYVYGVYKWLAFKSEVISIPIDDAYKQPKVNILSDFIYRFKSRMGISNYFWGFKSKPPPLISHQWLIHAIQKNVESHINDYVDHLCKFEIFDNNLESKLEKLIRKKTMVLLREIACNDEEFLLKIKKLNNTY